MKKTYKKPELQEVKIDNTITLVMYSDENNPPGGDPFATGGGNAPANTDNSSFKTETFEKSPFKEK